ncbi:hypothetical protein [Nocardia lijiangensis]|uniref:hypothetical protein n=1 Tax=Nocardia lijiangensis TaxID=299618 RepID=UPI003D754CEF
MNKLGRVAASMVVSLAAVGGLALIGVGTAQAGPQLPGKMTKSQCDEYVTRKNADHKRRQDPTSTHATYSYYACEKDVKDTQGRQLYKAVIKSGNI